MEEESETIRRHVERIGYLNDRLRACRDDKSAIFTACDRLGKETEFLRTRNEELRSGIESILRGLAVWDGD